MTGQRSVALVMIVRDEERCIRRALRSVQGCVDDMVVVDTGSIDATEEIARAEGARVHSFTWCDDFAAAKNYALDLAASAEFSLVLDADEWLVGGHSDLHAWADSERSPRFGTVVCTSTFGLDGQSVKDRLVRLLPRGARFAGRVHEQPVGTFPVAASPLSIAHDGYEPAQWARKCGRNENLLRAELDTSPGDGYSWYQLGCALDVDGRHAEACEAFERALPLLSAQSPQRHPLVARYLYSLGQARRFDEALAFYRQILPEWPQSPDLHFVMSEVLLDLALAQPVRSQSLLPLIRALLQRCLEIGERSDLPGAVSGRGSTLARHNLDIALGCQSFR